MVNEALLKIVCSGKPGAKRRVMSKEMKAMNDDCHSVKAVFAVPSFKPVDFIKGLTDANLRAFHEKLQVQRSFAYMLKTIKEHTNVMKVANDHCELIQKRTAAASAYMDELIQDGLGDMKREVFMHLLEAEISARPAAGAPAPAGVPMVLG